MNPVRSTRTRHKLTLALIGATGLGAPPGLLLLAQPAAAQRRDPPIQYVIDSDGGTDFDMRSVERGFALFAGLDAAFSGMRATGHYGTAISNYGDCDGTLRNCQNNRIQRPNGTFAPFFEIEWAYGVPPSQFGKIRNVAPSVGNAAGRGWMAAYNRTVMGQPKRIGPHDGTLGRIFSGVTSTDDRSCRDHTGFTNGNYLAGIQLLPTSDCPETWGSEGWQGAHPIDGTGWKRWFDRSGPAFTFDFWRVPEAYQRVDKAFLGTRHHTYGESSDYNAEVLANYGSVVPGGVGQPRFQGYPLGLLIHFEAFNFALAPVNSAYFVQATIVNRSEDLWGRGIDYDSLYFGLSQGAFFSNDNESRYAVPDRGLVAYHNSGVQGAAGPCGDPNRQPFAGNACSTGGYGSGAVAMIFLKTPLGDLRNKLFTRTARGAPCIAGVHPFCAPSHPLRGDTITFNRQTYGDFGGADVATWGTSTRAAFGFMSGMEENTLDGRSIGDFSQRTQWRTFRSEFWPTIRAHHNKYVPPGSWDYDHDGILDTLVLDTCGRNGCVEVDSDTMPSGHVNNRGNIGGLQSFGPFSLRAGDTTSFVYAILGEADSVQLWSQVAAVLDLYLDFYLAPEAPPPMRVVSTQVMPGTDEVGTAIPRVRLYLSDSAQRWVDPYLVKYADALDSAPLGTVLGDLAALNPTLAADVRARAADNVGRLEIYKSCDGGRSYTADDDCAGDPTVDVDGSAPGDGWRAYAIFTRGAQTDIPNVFTDDAVQDGRTYTYAVVVRSRGARFLVVTPAGADSLVVALPLRTPFPRERTDPNLASIYVPVSRPAGYQPARVGYTARPRGATVPFVVELLDSVIGGSYRAIFGNELLVTRDSLVSTGLVPGSTVSIRRRETVSVGFVGVDSVIARESFRYADADEFPVAGPGVAAPPVTSGDTLRTTTTYAGLGFLVVGPQGPIFGTTRLTGAAATPTAVLDRPGFPGFVVTANQAVAGNYHASAEAQLRGALSIAELNLGPADTLVPRNLVDNFMVQWREQSSGSDRDGVGQYEITWVDDPFGVSRGFVLTLSDTSTTEVEVQATLAARAVGTVGLTGAETAELLNVDQLDLIAVKVPFSVRNRTFDRPVDVAMVRRLSDRILLGFGNDTVSVDVPRDHWIPGDRLVFIEDVVDDSITAEGLVLGPGGAPLQRTRRAVTFWSAVLGCQQVRESCNPVVQGSAGATGYNPMRAGDRTRFGYYAGFPESGEFAFDVVPPVTGGAITAVTDSALARIRVVPNPYLLYSRYQSTPNEPRLLFTNVPPRGTLRIYTVAGQFVQQITWDPAGLQGDGDLFWNLTTHSGWTVASGLYLWVLTAPSNPADPASRPLRARGKLVIIRGEGR